MKTKVLGLIACMALLGSTLAANASPYVVTLEEVGSNVVATGAGQLDLTGLSITMSSYQGEGGLEPDIGFVGVGGSFEYIVTYSVSAPSGPTNFGTGDLIRPSSSSGPLVGWQYNLGYLSVPTGYVSDALLSTSTATFDGQTFATLDITPGTYVWTWGGGSCSTDQCFELEIGEIGQTPIPAALPLFATGLGGLGLFGWRKKRKNAAAIAA
jgi:hypothetical protein